MIHSASFLRIAIIVPLTENARGSLNSDLLTNSISWPGVNPISKILLHEGCFVFKVSILNLFSVF